MWSRLEKTIGSMKFAVFIIAIFSVLMIIGTFIESYYGAAFASKVLYKTWYFFLIQFLMGLSILFAAFLRLPPKKRLYGFYTIHTGLILLGCGGFITWYSGIDGQVVLNPNDPSREIILNDDIVRISYPDENKQYSKKLPLSAFEYDIDEEFEGIKFKSFYPFSAESVKWEEDDKKFPSSEYFLSNDRISQDFILTLNPKASDFDSSVSLGPLNIRYLPILIAKCFKQNTPSSLIFWNIENQECFTPEERNIPIHETKSKKKFIVFKDAKGDPLSFFPYDTPWPMAIDSKKGNFSPLEKSPWRAFNKKIFEKAPNLFLFGEKFAYFDRDEEKWEVQSFNKQKQNLPWMGFVIELIKDSQNKYPIQIPHYTLPVFKDGKIAIGDIKSLQLEIQGETYWVTNQKPLQLLINGRKTIIQILKENLLLPFEMTLTNFKMDKDPGTNSPASYESFVKVFTADGPLATHIYMNNPLKLLGYTFYQASYFQTETGHYGSVLSANIDPGRPIKYLGSLLLVFGTIWHYRIRKKKGPA